LRGGLRLASSEPAASEAAPDKRVESTDEPGDEPPPSAGGDSPRPTLKRVK
jgi:hypothetical protein